jgi:hypothetical protein
LTEEKAESLVSNQLLADLDVYIYIRAVYTGAKLKYVLFLVAINEYFSVT